MAVGGTQTPRVRAAIGADLTANPATWTWTDISSWARGTVTVSRGTQDRTSVPATRIEFRLNNNDARWSPWHPSSPYCGLWDLRTPVEVSLDPGTGYVVRGVGYVDTITPTWPSGNSTNAEVEVLASGALWLIGQSRTPQSALLRALAPVPNNFYYYWSLEDPSGSTGAAPSRARTPSGAPGVAPLALTGTINWASRSGLAGSAPLPDFSGGGSLSAPIPDTTGVTGLGSAWSVQFAFQLPALGAGQSVSLVGFGGGAFALFAAQVGAGGLSFTYFGTTTTTGVAVDDGAWHLCQVTFASLVGITITIDGVIAYTSGGGVALTTTTAATVQVNPWGSASSFSIGHLAIGRGLPNVYADFLGNAGESCSARLARLAAQDGIQITITGSSTTLMGPQPVAAPADLYQECADTDRGVLRDGLTAGLTYLAGPSRYNPPVALALDVQRRHVKVDFRPVLDDSRTVNIVTATRGGGGSYTYLLTDPVDPRSTARGDYARPASPNVSTDSALPAHASWRVHEGTSRELRIPAMRIMPSDTTDIAAAWLAVDLGARYTAINMPTQWPGGSTDQVLDYYVEEYDKLGWTVDLTGSPTAIWRVGVLEDATYPIRCDTSGSTLDAGTYPAGTISLPVSHSTGPRWVVPADSPASFPFDILVAGIWRVTVTSISGTGTSQTFTVNPTPVAFTAGADVRVYPSAVLAL